MGTIALLSRRIVRISRWLCQRVDAAIVKSEGMQKAAPAGNVFVIPNGVDFELFHPIPPVEARAALGWDVDRCYVLFGNGPKIPGEKEKLLYSTYNQHPCDFF